MKKALFALLVALNSLLGEEMEIILKNQGAQVLAKLDDSAVTQEFAVQLPLRLNLSDYAGKEKVATLPKRLDVSSEPRGRDGKRGEISYFAPWNNFVIYYGDQPYYDGIVRLGVVSGDVSKVAKDGWLEIELKETK